MLEKSESPCESDFIPQILPTILKIYFIPHLYFHYLRMSSLHVFWNEHVQSLTFLVYSHQELNVQ